MATKISWAEETWNPIAGCTVCSPGCANCYAMKMAYRLEQMGQPKYAGLTKQVNDRHIWTGEVRLAWDELDRPLRWKTPRRVFVNSMSDLFHKDVPIQFVDQVMDTIRKTPQHTYQILTKRADQMAAYLLRSLAFDQMLPVNIWWGVSVEDDKHAAERVPLLAHCATRRGLTTFISYEPALGPVNWKPEWASGISQIIVGAESGPDNRRRPFSMQWARDTRDYCLDNQIAFFFKQQSHRKSGHNPYIVNLDGRRWQWHQYPGDHALPVEVTA